MLRLGDFQEGLHQGAPSRIAAASAPVPAVSRCQPTPLQETFQHQQGDMGSIPGWGTGTEDTAEQLSPSTATNPPTATTESVHHKEGSYLMQ